MYCYVSDPHDIVTVSTPHQHTDAHCRHPARKTLTAFIGGQAPFFFLEFDGFNLIRGLFWLIIVDPIVLTVAYWIFMLLMLPLIGLAAGASTLTNRKHDK